VLLLAVQIKFELLEKEELLGIVLDDERIAELELCAIELLLWATDELLGEILDELCTKLEELD